MGKKLIRSFTLVEIIFVVVIISIGLVSILYAINSAFDNVQSTKQRVIAINLAREGMEGIYQIRDTNRLLGPAKKDECWLDMNPLIDEGYTPDGCVDDNWMGSGNYILQKLISGNQQSFYLSGGSDWNGLDLSDGIQSGDIKFALCQSGGLREACTGNSTFVSYFREIHGEGVFLKDSDTAGGDYLNCVDYNSNRFFYSECGGSEAKEYRFCSKVSYIGQGNGSVELCGIITNFSK